MQLGNKTLHLVMLCVLTVTLQGCALNKNKLNNSDDKNKSAITAIAIQPSSPSNFDQSTLTTCLFEAEQLSKLKNKNYAADINSLYNTINEAKYYSSIAASVNNATAQMITPYYKYKVADSCNRISQLLLQELKSGISITSSRIVTK